MLYTHLTIQIANYNHHTSPITMSHKVQSTLNFGPAKRPALAETSANATVPCKRPATEPPAAEHKPPPKKHAALSTTDLEAHLTGLVRKLYQQKPNHEIFGSPTAGHIRLPCHAIGRKNGQCWVNKMKQIANWVIDEMGERWSMDSCWMSTKGQIQITNPTGGHSSEVYASITVTRLLAFFASPTPENWAFLTSDTPTNCPFSHRCGRGHLRYDGTIGCLNGVRHGGFSDRKENEDHKTCRNGALALCPGHGTQKIKCIFTNDQGDLLPCRMWEDHVPICRCDKKCF